MSHSIIIGRTLLTIQLGPKQPWIIRLKLTALQIKIVVLCQLLGIDIHSDSGARRHTPVWAVRDGNRFRDNIVRHHVGSLLIAIHYVRKREKNLVAGRGGDSEFAVRVPADLKTLIVGAPAQALELGQ